MTKEGKLSRGLSFSVVTMVKESRDDIYSIEISLSETEFGVGFIYLILGPKMALGLGAKNVIDGQLLINAMT